MPARMVDLIDSMVSHINGVTWSLAFTAQSKLFQRYSVDEIDSLQVELYAGPEQWVKQNRASQQLKTLEVNLVILQRVDSDEDNQIEPLMELAEELKDNLVLQSFNNFHCVEVEQEQPYDPDLMHTCGLFSATTTYRFRGF